MNEPRPFLPPQRCTSRRDLLWLVSQIPAAAAVAKQLLSLTLVGSSSSRQHSTATPPPNEFLDAVRVFLYSSSVATLRCWQRKFTWAIGLKWLPPLVRRAGMRDYTHPTIVCCLWSMLIEFFFSRERDLFYFLNYARAIPHINIRIWLYFYLIHCFVLRAAVYSLFLLKKNANVK